MLRGQPGAVVFLRRVLRRGSRFRICCTGETVRRKNPCQQIRVMIVFVLLLCPTELALGAEQQQWIRVSSDHFIVLTDAGEKKGHEVAARFEQMRAVFGQLLMRRKLGMSQPLEIIAVRTDKDFAQLAPLVNGQASNAPAFFLAGDDRIYFVLNLFLPDSWRAVEHQFAHYLLNYNYPPTQPWFDEGFAEYFASLYLGPKQAELGSDPELNAAYQTDLLGNTTESTSLKSLTEILTNPVWLTLPDLFGMKNRVVNGQEGTHHTLFYAQSWMLVHYLLKQNKLSETGAYFDLVENQKVPVEQAVEQAYGMTVTQLDKAVKDYFRSLTPLFDALNQSKQSSAPAIVVSLSQSALPFAVNDVATSTKSVPLVEAQALINEMQLRVPERREQAMQKLEALVADSKTETAVAHRALAWAHLQKGETSAAFEEENAAMQINSNDPWVRFGLAQASYHSGEKGARVQGLANMMESLHIVINEYPDFAEAYNMLGWARLAGGGANAALEAMKVAVQLSPRNEEYQLRLARAFLAVKKFDEATATLERLKLSPNPQIAKAAKKDLNDLPFLKKYGMPPAEEASAKPEEPAHKEDASANASKHEDDGEETDVQSKSTPPLPEIDHRPIKFLKATLVSVDCSHAPVAVLAISQGGRMLKLRAPDYKSVAVIGAEQFSCGWKNIGANFNYRAGGKMDGDLVSVEVK
jgi:tetratricopeptide (TPR) repeat protein